MTEESAVKVCVRVRPLVPREEVAASENEEPVQLFWKADKKSIHQIDDGSSNRSFSFDRVFSAEETTIQLYQAIAKPLVVSTVGGYNGTVFAYGQTSSGKTFTMMGRDHNPGVIPLAVEDVFQSIKNFPKKEFLLRVSYMEIYNETVTDLLVDSWKRKPLEVRETNKNIYVADLTEELVTSPAQTLAWIRKGEKNRHYAKTKMNQRSSRSHAIFRMILESRERSDPASGDTADGAIIVSHLNLVDLAGSERASQTGAEGARFKEGCNINRSLFVLGQVIKKLTDESQKGFTNYRDSKLTRILQNSLGGNAKTVIICTITPATLEETLSTLQFASTAKKMKNDPHVTEVSDDGALLKRYRNEIVELKQRLQEVSSVTQTTVTEKEVLSQLLQEKDQLQREQEDRIKNLTKLLVTGSNLVPVLKMPKRRMTWGGKMLKLAQQTACEDDDGMSDLSFVDPFSRKRKAHISCLTELGEADEFFDSQWEIPEEPPYEMETSESSVTARSFGDSSREFVSPDRICQLTEKVSSLEVELHQREEAIKKADTLESTVAELQLQLQTEAQEKQNAVEKMQMAEERVADLERQLQEQSHLDSKRMSREFAETIQLCETLASEKEMVIAERDYLKQELGMFMEQTQKLEQEKAALSQELNERRELDEFESLEDRFTKERENELQKEISSLKKAIKSSEIQCLELQDKLQTLSDDLRMKTEFVDDLQNMNGKDLVQEMATLRRSLDDAEGVSRDTKKEWAILRSENMALEELNVTLTAKQEKMEAEMNSLLVQLETQKSLYKKMQSDLQKELNVAFEENTTLTTLLDGKVPQNLIDGVELGRTVAQLEKELTASREAEKALRAELETLALFQALPDQVESLTKQVCDLTEELHIVTNQKDNLVSGQTQCEQEAQQLRDSLQTSKDEFLKIQADLNGFAQREDELKQLCADVTQQLNSLRSELERSETERSQLVAFLEERDVKLKQVNEALECVQAEKEALLSVQSSTEEVDKLLSTITSVSAERDQLRIDLQSHMEKATETDAQLQSLQQELHEQKQQNSDMIQMFEQKESELGEQILRLSQELQSVHDGMSSAESSAEVERLLSAVASLTAERDQLKMDLQENIEMMIENQEELRTAQEKNREQMKQIKLLKSEKASQMDGDFSSRLEELQEKIRTLTGERDSVRSERDALILDKEAKSHSEEVEELLCRVTSLSEERDQLQETLEGLREEKKQLREELEDKIQMLAQTQSESDRAETVSQELQADERLTQLQREAAETQRFLSSLQEQLQQQNQKYTDMQRINQEEQAQLEQQLSETKSLLQSLEEELQTKSDQIKRYEQKESEYEPQMKTLTEELANTRAERDALILDKEANSHSEEVEELLCRVTSLSEERDQLQETLEGLREEKKQLREELEDKIQMMQCEFQEHLNFEPRPLTDEQEAHRLQQLNSLRSELEQSETERSQLVAFLEERDVKLKQVNEALECVQAEKEALLSVQSSTEEVDKLLSTITSVSAERDQLRIDLQSHMEKIEQLEEMLENTKEEMSRLRFDLQENVTLMTEKQEELKESQEKSRVLEEELTALKHQMTELEVLQSSSNEADKIIQSLGSKNQRLTQELESVRAERDSLMSEKEAASQTKSEEMEELQFRVTSLSEERDQLQETLNGLREELEDRRETLQAQLDIASALHQQIDKLNTSLQTLTEQNKQMEEDLQQRVEMVSSTQELLKVVQDKLHEQRNMNSNLKNQSQENESSLNQKISDLVKNLESVEAERNCLLSEKETNSQAHTEEVVELRCRVTSLSEEKYQLQEKLEELREEKQQLNTKLEDMTQTISTLQEKFTQQGQQQAVKEEQDAVLHLKVQHLEEQLQVQTEQQARAQAEADASQQLLNEAKSAISDLKQQLNTCEQDTRGVEDMVSSRLQDTTSLLQESFGKFQEFIETCSKYKSTPLETLRVQGCLKPTLLNSLPKATMEAYGSVYQLGLQTVQNFQRTREELRLRAVGYRNVFEELVKKDLAIFEEKRLQDLLLSRTHALTFSIKDLDFHTLWEQRLSELLDKQQLYLQKMDGIVEKLWNSMSSYFTEEKSEIRGRQKFTEQLERISSSETVSFTELSCILRQEADRRSGTAQNSKMSLQFIMNEQNSIFDELKRMESESKAHLREEKSKSSTLLQALEGAPLKTEVSLLKDNQQLDLQLRQAEGNIKALHVQIEELEEAQTKANDSVCQHKKATQLLQTELQDTRTLVQEKDDAIQTLRSKLRESEKKASPSAAELENLRNELFQAEVKLTSISDEHKQEMQKMKTLLSEKEESLRKLKEALRKSQQQGEESFLQGEDLHARLTNPKGVVIRSSIVEEKNKLEETVQKLLLKKTELESLVSSQQAEIAKWKNRAIKLKGKNKAEVDKTSPCTPTKRALPLTPDPDNLLSSPQKILFPSKKMLDSPKKVSESPIRDSFKSRFFDLSGSSDLLSRSRPRQFFDNSALGTIPDVDVGGDTKEECWPRSPKEEEMCHTQ